MTDTNADEVRDAMLISYQQGLEHGKREARNREMSDDLARAIEALAEAIYMLNPDERDMEKQAGVYRIVKAYEALTGKRVILADEGGKDDV